jgi:hypothetical protein
MSVCMQRGSYKVCVLAFPARDSERGYDFVAYLEGSIQGRSGWRRSWVKRRTKSNDMTDEFMSTDVTD